MNLYEELRAEFYAHAHPEKRSDDPWECGWRAANLRAVDIIDSYAPRLVVSFEEESRGERDL
jgi:hypothetical protein